jgi:hypothetical protein
MPGINDLKEERFILAHGFRRAWWSREVHIMVARK